MLTIYGRNTLIQALSSKHQVQSIYLEENIHRDDKVSSILDLANKSGTKIEYVNKGKLQFLTKSNEHQGVAALVDFQEYKLKDLSDEDLQKSFIYISEATFEHNIGAIIRTAEVLGFGGVIIPKDISITPIIAKISTGAVFFIPVLSIPIFQAIKSFRDLGFFVYGIERDGERYSSTNLTSSNLYIIGGEDKSLTQNIRERCDEIIEIPQFGETNSLNMSVAAGIIMSEDIRQKLSAQQLT